MRSTGPASSTASTPAVSFRSASRRVAKPSAATRRAPVRAHEAHHLHLRMLGPQEVDQVGGHESARARDQHPHRYIPRPCWLPSAPIPLKLPMEPTLARSMLKRNCLSWRPL